MNNSEIVAYYLENLWSKGFKLTDEEVRFIYFGMKYTNTSAKQVKIALSLTLQIQLSFDGSFYISLLELFHSNHVKTMKEARKLLQEKQVN
ncbi:hypothetical protein F9U64_04640 [Gracilibacillus oryzae]|uniref:Uncharacterized protein n=1 Tax=Gracilibacillus oryzae TaxID=1672701 RepID=A0A7C8GUQ8_9BACI|nr:DUF6123 family protein [Gracilibacillus oryzae]KAB8138444.1 hypothetical protein F9U64_04640 [Gracilibacillus oryzae]